MSQPPVDLGGLLPCDQWSIDDADDERLGNELLATARSYLASFAWCGEVVSCYASDLVIGGVVAVLLCEIRPARPEVDQWLWVVVGDLPPAYLVTDDADSALDALSGYVIEMRRWIAAVRLGEPTDDLIPVTTAGGVVAVAANIELVDQLERRLDFLEAELLSGHS